MPLKPLICGALLALVQSTGSAAGPGASAVAVEQAQARATAAGQSIGGAYMTLINRGVADRLVSARVAAGVARSVELHTMSMQGDVMRMRQLEAIELPAGQTIELKPGGVHLMLIGLKAPLKAGASFPMTLRFEKAGEVVVQVPVNAPVGTLGADHGMKH